MLSLFPDELADQAKKNGYLCTSPPITSTTIIYVTYTSGLGSVKLASSHARCKCLGEGKVWG